MPRLTGGWGLGHLQEPCTALLEVEPFLGAWPSLFIFSVRSKHQLTSPLPSFYFVEGETDAKFTWLCIRSEKYYWQEKKIKLAFYFILLWLFFFYSWEENTVKFNLSIQFLIHIEEDSAFRHRQRSADKEKSTHRSCCFELQAVVYQVWFIYLSLPLLKVLKIVKHLFRIHMHRRMELPEGDNINKLRLIALFLNKG